MYYGISLGEYLSWRAEDEEVKGKLIDAFYGVVAPRQQKEEGTKI